MKNKSNNSFLSEIENWTLFILLVLMILLSFANIIIRNTSGGGIVWADKLLISVVLWIAAVGGAAAACSEEHITISIFATYMSKKNAAWMKLGRDLVSSIITFMLSYYSFSLMLIEFSEHKEFIAFIETWVPMSILPPAFLIMALRYSMRTFKNIVSLKKTAAQ